MTVAVYARFSSDLQDARSIEDQVATCRRILEREAPGAPCAVFADFALSGSTMATRPQLQALLADVRGRRVTLVVAEALDRLSRDQADIALIHRTIRSSGARLVTVSEGLVDALHIGLKGTMNQLFVEELARKTRRGMEGVARSGRIPGGRCFGYDAVFGKPGERTVNEAEAAVVRELFDRYAAGESPRALAHALNQRGAPSPTGNGWTASSINGDRRAGDGVLCQELYRGRLVFNRRRFVKDPETGRRRAELNPPEAWTVTDVPALRIVTEDQWAAVQRRQRAVAQAEKPWQKRRPKRLLSGLVRCGCCGGGVTIVGRDALGCSAARERGTCDNRRTLSARGLEGRVLAGVKRSLLAPELVAEAVRGYHEELRAQRQQDARRRAHLSVERAEAARRLDRVAEALIDAGANPTLLAKLREAEERLAALDQALGAIPADAVVEVHPAAAEVYRKRVAQLEQELAGDEASQSTTAAIRALITAVIVTPLDAGAWGVDIEGDLAAILTLAQETENPTGKAGGVSVLVGAGARSSHYRGACVRVVA